MTIKRALIMLVQGGVVGLLFAVALSGDNLISAQAWLAAAVVWVAGRLLWDFVSAASIEPAELVIAWSRRRRQRRAVHSPSGLHALRALLTKAQNDPRAHANQLRPRLLELAKHHVSIRHGIDLNDDPDRATALLGEVGWMIDPAVVDRTPTLAEIHRFLDVILGEQDWSQSPHRRWEEVGAI